jgi:hypothetical protein
LNRARIHDALARIEQYDGVTGHMVFDPNQKNVAPMYLGRVHDGAITYRPASMEREQAYAHLENTDVNYAGPARADQTGPMSVVLFGPDADSIAQSAEMKAASLDAAKHGIPWKLLPVASNQGWGVASTQLVHDLFDQHALAIVALDRDSSHLAEQLALKSFVPVLALSNDKSLTSTNVPWIFRMPSDTKLTAALKTLETALKESGSNPQRLRDVLASGSDLSGISFSPNGEPKEAEAASPLRNGRSDQSLR